MNDVTEVIFDVQCASTSAILGQNGDKFCQLSTDFVQGARKTVLEVVWVLEILAAQQGKAAYGRMVRKPVRDCCL